MDYLPAMKRSVGTMVGERIKSLRLQSRGGKLTQQRLASLAEALEVPLDELFREKNHLPELTDATLRPLAEFVQRHRLSRREVDRLLTVAEALFGV